MEKREIKFRAWEEDEKYMRYGAGDLENQTSVFMQYTGLTDKNGKEIYEGDIWQDVENVRGHVIFEGGAFRIDCASKGAYLIAGRIAIAALYKEGGEVIGNIHSNPELLS